MSFEVTSRNISIKHNVLSAECRDCGQRWKKSSLDLDKFIGNIDGAFSFYSKDFSRSAKEIQLRGATLYATLTRRDQKPVQVHVDLNTCIANMNGSLKFQKPNEHLLNCGSCFSLEESRLRALCVGYDKRLHVAEIDLDECFENADGELSGAGRNFYPSARKLSLEPSSRSLLLRAQLRSNHWVSADFWNLSEADLVDCVKVRGGRLVHEKGNRASDRAGPFTRFFERAPFVEFVVAEINAQASNEEDVGRIRAFCANSSIVCGGIIIGTLVGGPLGGMIGAGLAAPVGALAETQASGTVPSPQLRARLEEATVGCYLYETLRHALADGAAEYLGGFLAQQPGRVTAQLMGEVAAAFGARVTKVKSEFAAYWLLKKVSDSLIKGEVASDWLETKAEVEELRAKK